MLGLLNQKSIVRVTAAVLLLTAAAWLLPGNVREANAAAALQNPRMESEYTVTWDCVYFGHYPQTSNGRGGFNNDPIKWRVLSTDGKEALLLADKSLDAGSYNEKAAGVTWETCTIRGWLNGSGSDQFLGKAFTSAEQEAINEKRIQNPDNPYGGAPGGNATRDKAFLLSLAEAMNPSYGFPDNYNDGAQTRRAVNTDYAKKRGADTNKYSGGTGCWWLRSPGDAPSAAVDVQPYGNITREGRMVDSDWRGVRPALYLNLSSNLWSYAGKVTSFAAAKPQNIAGIKVKPGKKKLTVTWKRNAKATGYQVMIARDSKFIKGQKTAMIKTNKTTKKTFKNLNAKKTYYVAVRAYKTLGGDTFYGSYSKAKKVRVK